MPFEDFKDEDSIRLIIRAPPQSKDTKDEDSTRIIIKTTSEDFDYKDSPRLTT